MTPSQSSHPNGNLTFVIPIVHPNRAKINNYDVIEQVLKLTLASLTSQTQPDTRVVVVCHKLPDWHAEFAKAVKFLTVGGHPGFGPNVNSNRRDKGMKYLAGIWYALQDNEPTLIMPMDGDDYVRRDLASTLLALTQDEDKDGYLIEQGYHAALRALPEGFLLYGAFQLGKFHKTCGSCRVFHSQDLRQKVLDFLPEIEALKTADIADTDGTLRKELIDQIVSRTDEQEDDQDNLVQLLGRHTFQGTMFKFNRLSEPFAAKGCGHENHVGGKGGGVHWANVNKSANPQDFLNEFGLGDDSSIRPAANFKISAMGTISAAFNNLLKRT